jgi:hypothetical protein
MINVDEINTLYCITLYELLLPILRLHGAAKKMINKYGATDGIRNDSIKRSIQLQLAPCHSVHQNFHTTWPALKPGLP